jgi:hypothetical protein
LLVVWTDRSDVAASLSITIQDSRGIAVQLSSSVDIINLRVTFHNVTVDASEVQTSLGVVCTSPSAACLPLLQILDCNNVINTTVDVRDVSYVRNATMIKITRIARVVSRIAVTLTQVVANSTNPVVSFTAIAGGVSDSNITVNGGDFTAFARSATEPFGVVLVTSSMDTSFIVLNDITMGGGTVDAPDMANVLSLQSMSCVECHVCVMNVRLAATLGSGCAVFLEDVIATHSSFLIVRSAIAVTFQGAWRLISIQSTIVDESSITAFNCSATTEAVAVLSGALSFSTVHVLNVVSTGTLAAVAARDVISTIPRIINVSIIVQQSSSTGKAGGAITFSNVSIKNVAVSLNKVVVDSQYFGVVIELIERGSSALNLSILNSWISSPHPLHFAHVDLINSSAVVTASILRYAGDSSAGSVRAPLNFENVVLRRSSVIVDDIRIESAASAPSNNNLLLRIIKASFDESHIDLSITSLSDELCVVHQDDDADSRLLCRQCIDAHCSYDKQDDDADRHFEQPIYRHSASRLSGQQVFTAHSGSNNQRRWCGHIRSHLHVGLDSGGMFFGEYYELGHRSRASNRPLAKSCNLRSEPRRRRQQYLFVG